MKFNHLFGGILAVLLLHGATAQAQTTIAPRRPGRVMPKPRTVAVAGVGLKDGLAMQKGRVVLTEAGITNPLTGDKKLLNGTVISSTGLITGTDGVTTQLTEGDMVSLTGRLTTRTSMAEADSLLKIKTYDLKYPGKRKQMEEDREKKAKKKAKADEKKAKELAKKKK